MTPATTSLIETFKDPILNLLKDIRTEINFFIDDGLSDYIDSLRDKFMSTKTFLYRDENIPFYDTFYPISLKNHAKTKQFMLLNELLESSPCANIIGLAGSGKTMMMRHFFLSCIESHYRIPIYLELRNLNHFEGDIIQLIEHSIFNNRLSPGRKILERLMGTGKFIFLLDGFDEIFSNKINKVTNDLDDLLDKYPKNSFVISSRAGSGIESMPRFNNFYVQPLNKNELPAFIDKVLGHKEANLSKSIKDMIKSEDSKNYVSFLTNPLLFSMFILTYNSYPELPKRKSKFYWNVYDTLSTKHDSKTKRGAYQHERRAKLQNDELEEILKWLSYISIFEGYYNFDEQYLTTKLQQIKHQLNYKARTIDLIHDLTVALGILVIDGIYYRFPHKSLQEYFCSRLIQGQTQENSRKIYQSKFNQMVKATKGGTENFWNLCLENDKHNFIQHFLLYYLNRFLELFRADDKIENLRRFYKESGLGNELAIEKLPLSMSIGKRTVYQPEFEIFIRILRYVGIMEIDKLGLDSCHNFQELNKFLLNSSSSLRYHPLDQNVYLANISVLWNDRLIVILCEQNFHLVFNKIIEDVKANMANYKEELRKIDNITHSLLDV
jgi:hypothetical protein